MSMVIIQLMRSIGATKTRIPVTLESMSRTLSAPMTVFPNASCFGMYASINRNARYSISIFSECSVDEVSMGLAASPDSSATEEIMLESTPIRKQNKPTAPTPRILTGAPTDHENLPHNRFFTRDKPAFSHVVPERCVCAKGDLRLCTDRYGMCTI
jgi:hypothetical protein